MSQPCNFRIRFVKPWGHPTRNLIMGTGDIALVSQSIRDNLVSGGYAEDAAPEPTPLPDKAEQK